MNRLLAYLTTKNAASKVMIYSPDGTDGGELLLNGLVKELVKHYGKAKCASLGMGAYAQFSDIDKGALTNAQSVRKLTYQHVVVINVATISGSMPIHDMCRFVELLPKLKLCLFYYPRMRKQSSVKFSNMQYNADIILHAENVESDGRLPIVVDKHIDAKPINVPPCYIDRQTYDMFNFDISTFIEQLLTLDKL